MKRFGFTLAEVLITLGIIGVVSALTLPTLLNDTTGAQIGPKLGKAAAMFEQANQALLDANNIDSLADGGFLVSNSRTGSPASDATYFRELGNHLKFTNYRGAALRFEGGPDIPGLNANANDAILTKDGTVIALYVHTPAGNGAPHQRSVGFCYIDINGASGPNLSGADQFAFRLMMDGSLVPIGSGNWAQRCPNNETPTDYYSCTASIFENNMKVMYKMR